MLTTAQLKTVAKASFSPKSRKFRIVERSHYQMADYWDGGTREYAIAVNLTTGQTCAPTELAHNPMRGQAHAAFEIPAGVGIISHQIFCGRDSGITIYVAKGCSLTADPCTPQLADQS